MSTEELTGLKHDPKTDESSCDHEWCDGTDSDPLPCFGCYEA